MFSQISQNINSELYFIYGLIVVVILLIIIVLIIDRKDAKRNKRRTKLTDTLNMKPITNDMLRDSKYHEDIEVIDMMDEEKEEKTYFTRPIPKIKLDLEEVGMIEEKEDKVLDEDDDEIYHDTELEKTQAQLRVEEITKALEKAKIEEQMEEERDKYQDYEEEQERNAIISYEELKGSYDKLYEESEKKQYMDDNSIPINIKELYEANDREDEYRKKYVEEDVELLDTDNSYNKKNSDIDTASDFLTTLKELRNNL